MSMDRVRTALTGFPGAPGVQTLYGLDGGVLQGEWKAFLQSIQAFIPLDVEMNVQNGGEVIDEANGDVTGVWAGSALDAVSGTNAGGYQAPTGFMIVWLTDQFINSRRLKGKTFIVPAASDQFDDTGRLSVSAAASIQGHVDTFLSSVEANLKVWHRPKNHAGGLSAFVTAAQVSRSAVVLHSRRD